MNADWGPFSSKATSSHSLSVQVSVQSKPQLIAYNWFAPLHCLPDWIVARLGVMEFLASGLGDSALQNDQTYLRGIQHIDAGPRNAASFVLCDQLVVG